MTQYERSVRNLRTASAVAVVSGFMALGLLEVHAQQATSFEQLQLLTKKGDTVTVTESSGQVSKGKILQLSRSSVQLAVGSNVRELTEAEVAEVKKRGSDSLGNGARNGAIAGAALGSLAAFLGECHNSSCAGDRAAVIGVTTAFGAGLGVGVDALIIRTRVIYRNGHGQTSAQFNIAPIINSRHQGIALSMRF